MNFRPFACRVPPTTFGARSEQPSARSWTSQRPSAFRTIMSTRLQDQSSDIVLLRQLIDVIYAEQRAAREAAPGRQA